MTPHATTAAASSSSTSDSAPPSSSGALSWLMLFGDKRLNDSSSPASALLAGPPVVNGGGAAQLSPLGRELGAALFRVLDRGGKGYLSPEEFAYAGMVAVGKHATFNAALGVLERNIGGLDAQSCKESIDRARSNIVHKKATSAAEVSVSNKTMSLPSATFFAAEHDRAHHAASAALSALLRQPSPSSAASPSSSPAASASSSSSSLLIPLPAAQWGRFSPLPCLSRGLSAPASMQAPLESLDEAQAAQSQVFEAYYTSFWNATYQAHFGMNAGTGLDATQRDALTSAAVAAAAVAKTAHGADAATTADATAAIDDMNRRGCTLDRFEGFLARELLLKPSHTLLWLSCLSSVLTGHHPHPTQQMCEAHDQGLRQGFLGHKRPATQPLPLPVS